MLKDSWKGTSKREKRKINSSPHSTGFCSRQLQLGIYNELEELKVVHRDINEGYV